MDMEKRESIAEIRRTDEMPPPLRPSEEGCGICASAELLTDDIILSGGEICLIDKNYRNNIVQRRMINYCPMCGRKLDKPHA